MSKLDRWLLPDGVEELLPPQAAEIELVRRKLLDKFEAWGYAQVVPPMVEFLESLLTGTGSDLDLKTFKVTDQVSGRTMGVRADITPQVARMDAHSLKSDGQSRLCYVGTVLHAKADNMLASRAPISMGAELFGSTGTSGDLEIVSLMIDAAHSIADQSIHVELGDVGIYRALVANAGLDDSDEEALFDAIQGKALPDLAVLIEDLSLDSELASHLLALPNLCGGEAVLKEAQQRFESYPEILERIDNLQTIAAGIESRFDVSLNYDLSELRGYSYHTGIVFATFLSDSGVRVPKGGRYDDVGKVFGRARSATGFDLDLKALCRESDIQLADREVVEIDDAELDGVDVRNALWRKIQDLRAEGFVVVEGQSDLATKRLTLQSGEWQLIDNPTKRDAHGQ